MTEQLGPPPPDCHPKEIIFLIEICLDGYRLEIASLERCLSAILERYIEPDYKNGDFVIVGARSIQNVPIFPNVLERVSQMLSSVKRGLEENNGRIIEESGDSCSQVMFPSRVSTDVGEGQAANQLIPPGWAETEDQVFLSQAR